MEKAHSVVEEASVLQEVADDEETLPVSSFLYASDLGSFNLQLIALNEQRRVTPSPARNQAMK